MAVFGKVAKWADSRLTPYGWKKNAFLKNPCIETFEKYSSTALKRIDRRAKKAGEVDASGSKAMALTRTLKDVNDTIMPPQNKTPERLESIAHKIHELAASLATVNFSGRPSVLDRFAMNAYVEAAQIYHAEAEYEHAEGDRSVAVGKYMQAFRCWEKAIVKMEDIKSTLSAENIMQHYMWAVGSANKAGLRGEARPYLEKLMQEARRWRALDRQEYNDAVRRITKYLSMLGYDYEAVKIYADRLEEFPAEKARPMLGDIFGISYELKFPEFGELVMERALAGIETQIKMYMKMVDGAVPVDGRLDMISNMAEAWRGQKFDDSFGFADKEKILSSLEFAGRVAGLAEKYVNKKEGNQLAKNDVHIVVGILTVAADLAEKEGNGEKAGEFRDNASDILFKNLAPAEKT